MATIVDTCNLALSRLGDEATVSSIDPPEGSAQATHCARFFPMARDTVLDYANWSFSTTRGAINKLSLTPKSGWLYAYAQPTLALNIIALFVSGSTNDDNPQQFECETLEDGSQVIYANIDAPICMYTLRNVDPSRFSPMAAEALIWLLMSNLAGPVLKGAEGMKMMQQCYQMFVSTVGRAAASDSQQRKVDLVHTPDFFAARGVNVQSQDDLGGWAR